VSSIFNPNIKSDPMSKPIFLFGTFKNNGTENFSRWKNFLQKKFWNNLGSDATKPKSNQTKHNQTKETSDFIQNISL
jgi:hypothetical protein